MNYFNYKRRPTINVPVGNVYMGGSYPVVIQTMTNTNTLDTEASVAQCERIIESVRSNSVNNARVREANNPRDTSATT